MFTFCNKFLTRVIVSPMRSLCMRCSLIALCIVGSMPVGMAGDADINILIVGSTGDTTNSGYVSGNSKAFDPTTVRTYLQSILQGAGVGTVNVAVENRGSPYGLAAWFHYPVPADVETTTRWPNLRGQKGTDWDYVIVIGDPYTMEYMPGLYAHGVAMVAQEVAMGGAETVLLMPWPASSSSSSVAHYKEVVYRAGRSGPYKVAPAALAWQAAGSPTGTAHPSTNTTTNGAFIAAAAIYSTIWNKSASTSTYVYNDALADQTHTIVTTNNNNANQYTGDISFQNPFLMLGDKRRDVHFSEKGTSTEQDFKNSAVAAMNRARVEFNHSSYSDKYTSNTPEDDGKNWPVANPMPIAWNHGRKFSETAKEYVTNPSYWQLGMGFKYQWNTWADTVEVANDKHLGQILSQDIDLADYMRAANNMGVGQHSTARIIPWRLIWGQMHHYNSALNPLRDGSGPHLNHDLHKAVGTYMYTIYSGRCPLDPKPTTMTTTWMAQKFGYETAWRVGRCQTRAPGFKVMPSAASKKTIAGGTTETMSVQFIFPPQNNVTVNISLSNPSVASLSTTQLTFTPGDYSSPKPVIITASPSNMTNQVVDVIFSTTSNDEVYKNLSDSWRYTCTPGTTPTVSWTSASQSSVNESGTMTVTAQLSAVSGQNVTVPFTVSGTATGADRTVTASPITITAGATTGSATITITQDTLDEPNETVILTMGTPTNATKGSPSVHTATITDDDGAPTVAWTTASQASANESGTMTVTAQLSTASGKNVTVPFTVTGTASGSDRTITASPIIIAAGATTGSATITITPDSLDEPNETVILTMGTPTNATKGSPSVHTATITDDDDMPTVTWTTASQASANESGTMTVTAQLSTASGKNVTVPFTVTGTASGSDYSITPSPITITAGATTGSATITITSDTIDESNETVILTMGTPTNATKGSPSVHTATITDDDDMPTVAWTAASQASANESGTMTVTAQLSSASSQNVTVPFTVTGTATGADYSITASPITITAGATTGSATITITSDTLDEPNETVILTIGTPTNATKGSPSVHTATITDDDGTPTVAWTAASQASANESGTMTVTAELSAVSGKTVTVPFTVTGTATGADYSITASPITITAGTTTASATITITSDTLDEPNETVILTIGTPTNATKGSPSVHTATITDDDSMPTVAWTAASQASANESGTMTVTAELSAASGQNVTVPFVVTGTATGADYSITASPITITAGATTGSATITITSDALDEPNETVILTIGTPTNATKGSPSVHTATITDDDGTPTVAFNATSSSGSEAVTTVTLPVSLSAASGQTVTVNYAVTGGTATGGGVDYTLASGTLNFSAETTTQNIAVTVVNDVLNEGNETIQVTLSGPSNATLGTNVTHTYTISDDDTGLPTVAWIAASQASANESGTMTVTAQLSATSAQPVTVPFTVTGTASGSDYTITASPLTITAGTTTASTTITITSDTLDEPNETVILTMGTPTNASLGATTVHTATITDDDGMPTVAWTAASQASANESGTMTVTAELSAVSGQNVTVPFVVTGTASGSDFTITASPLTITAGTTTASATITITSDTLDEPNETVVLTMGAPTNAILGATTLHTATITDDDGTPTIAFNATSSSGSEAVTAVTLPVSLSAASGQTVTVNYAVTGGTATGGGVDYTLASGTLNFSAGTTTQDIAVTVVNDVLNEGNETIQVTLSVPSNATLGTNVTHTYTISDDDTSLPTVAWSTASQASVNENGTMLVTAQLSATSAQSVTVPFTVTGTASGSDYTITASPITITAGATTGSATITITPDTLDEPNETVILTIGTPTNATKGSPSVHTATITDDDDTPTVAFNATSSSGSEAVTAVTLPVSLSAASGQSVTVNYAVTGGTATGGGVDYTLANGTLNFSAGTTTQNIAVTVVNDALIESNETIQVTLSSPSNATLGTNVTHTYTITDDDSGLPTVAWTAASQASANESGTMTVTAQLSATSAQTVTVPFTVTGTASGSDYTITASPLTITAGTTTASATITITPDSIDEPNETVILTMGTPTNASLGATTVHTATITDDDGTPTVIWTAASQASANESGTMTVTAQLSAVSGQTVTVPFAVTGTASGSDYTITASPLTITAGATTASATITITPDTIDEPNETVILTMGAPTNATLGATTVHTATITDDDGTPTVAFNATSSSGSEAVTAVALPVSLSATSGQTVTVNYAVTGGTATGGGVDYTLASGTLNFSAGTMTQNIAVTVVNDALSEANETILVTLSSPSNATLDTNVTHTYTIIDDDSGLPTVEWISSSQVSANESGTMIVTAQLSATSAQNVTVPFTVTGTASGSDYTITASPLTITAGTTTASATITITPDTLPEPNETVILTMGTPTNASLGTTTVHTATITDDDGSSTPSVAWTSSSQIINGAMSVNVTAQLSAASGFDVVVPFLLAGTATLNVDYTITGSPITIPAGQTSGATTITVLPDTINDPNETVVLTMGTPTNAILGAMTVHVATIAKDEMLYFVSDGSSNDKKCGLGLGINVLSFLMFMCVFRLLRRKQSSFAEEHVESDSE